MNYDRLLNLGVELGRNMMCSGAEIYRVEDSILRLMQAYGIPDAQVFAIPNCLIVSLLSPDGHPITRVCRIPSHGNNLDALEMYNALCRRLCREVPPLEEARAQVADIARQCPVYSLNMVLFGYFFAPAFFTPFFGGSACDALCGGLCGLAIGFCLLFLGRLIGPNGFFKTLIASTVSSLLALFLVHTGIGQQLDAITIGALMVLVPGVALTNALREIMAGDIVSGVSHTTESLLTATAIALGTGVGLTIAQIL